MRALLFLLPIFLGSLVLLAGCAAPASTSRVGRSDGLKLETITNDGRTAYVFRRVNRSE